MRRFNNLIVSLLAGVLILPPAPALAKTRKGDRLRNEARTAEVREDFDKALELASQAVEEDPSDPSYVLALRRMRFEAGSMDAVESRCSDLQRAQVSARADAEVGRAA